MEQVISFEKIVLMDFTPWLQPDDNNKVLIMNWWKEN